MFKVRIIEVTEVTRPFNNWVKVADSGGRDGGALYDYAPTERIEHEEHVWLEQDLERLDLRAVIDALNPPTRSHRRKQKP